MSKALVAYFSASGVTANVAERMATSIGADLYEIKPEQPYTSDDLNWQNRESRSSVEMKDKSSRPAIGNKVDDMEQYQIVFVGFPIWWYREPSIIDTFIEAYDFAGKTIVTFATSGGSGLGESTSNIQELAPETNVIDGKKFAGSVSETELKNWAERYL